MDGAAGAASLITTSLLMFHGRIQTIARPRINVPIELISCSAWVRGAAPIHVKRLKVSLRRQAATNVERRIVFSAARHLCSTCLSHNLELDFHPHLRSSLSVALGSSRISQRMHK